MPKQDRGQSAAQMRAVLEVAESVLAELDVEVVLSRVLEVARTLTSARYAAVGVLDEGRTQLERFITSGIDEATRNADRPPAPRPWSTWRADHERHVRCAWMTSAGIHAHTGSRPRIRR